MKEILNGDEAAPGAFTGAIGRGKIVADVRTEDDVDVFEKSGADIEGFCGDKFFGDAGKKFDRAGEMVFLHLLFQHERGSDVNGHAGVVAFAVAGSAINDGIVVGDAGLLRRARDAINIGDERDDGLAAPPRRHPGRGDSGDASLDAEAVLLENAGNVARGLEFLEAELAVAVDLIHHLLGESLKLVHFGDRGLLQFIERRGLLRAQRRNYR